MPQAVNRSLVGQMAAIPTGPGTVYTAMLKARLTNQKRATKVNDSEEHQLLKVKKVMERNSRYARWKSDQEIEHLRQSLNRLDAFQRVLREDVPLRKLIKHKRTGDNYCPQSPNVPIPRKGTTLVDGGISRHDNLSGETVPLIEEHRVNVNSCPNDLGLKGHGDEIRTQSQEREESKAKEEIKDDKKKENKNVRFKTSTHTATQGVPRAAGPHHLKIESDIISDSDQHASDNVVWDGSRWQRKPKVRAGDTISPEVVPINDKHQTNSHGIYQNNLTTDVDEKEQLRIERRMERKKRLEEKVVWRGFNMNTLDRQINRKLKAMDPKRKHKRVQGQMAMNSRQENERIIASNRAKFVAVFPKDDENQAHKQHPQAIDEEQPPRKCSDNANVGRTGSGNGTNQIAKGPHVVNPLLHHIPLPY